MHSSLCYIILLGTLLKIGGYSNTPGACYHDMGCSYAPRRVLVGVNATPFGANAVINTPTRCSHAFLAPYEVLPHTLWVSFHNQVKSFSACMLKWQA